MLILVNVIEKDELLGKSILKTLEVNLSKSQKSKSNDWFKSKNFENLVKS